MRLEKSYDAHWVKVNVKMKQIKKVIIRIFLPTMKNFAIITCHLLKGTCHHVEFGICHYSARLSFKAANGF